MKIKKKNIPAVPSHSLLRWSVSWGALKSWNCENLEIAIATVDLKSFLHDVACRDFWRLQTRIYQQNYLKSFMIVGYYCPSVDVLIHHLAEYPYHSGTLTYMHCCQIPMQWIPGRRKGERLLNKILFRVFKSSLQAVASFVPLTGIQIHFTL